MFHVEEVYVSAVRGRDLMAERATSGGARTSSRIGAGGCAESNWAALGSYLLAIWAILSLRVAVLGALAHQLHRVRNVATRAATCPSAVV